MYLDQYFTNRRCKYGSTLNLEYNGLGNGGDDDDEGAEDDEENGHDPHFEPIVPLPELIDVKTGEEEEAIVFKHRAKVFLFSIWSLHKYQQC